MHVRLAVECVECACQSYSHSKRCWQRIVVGKVLMNHPVISKGGVVRSEAIKDISLGFEDRLPCLYTAERLGDSNVISIQL